MFEIYAVVAIILLPTGLISLVHFLCSIQTNTKNKPILWTLILESILTMMLGVFYIYCSVILSQEESDANFVSNDADLAIINNTSYSDNEIPTFYNKDAPIPLDQTNEIEDTRNNKNEIGLSEFLENYQYLVQMAVEKKLGNVTNQERTSYQRMLYYARNLDNCDCFLRTFFYQALLVHSFVTCAISLLNTCHFCKEWFKNEPCSAMQDTKTDNSSETFGEKILDNVSDNSSQNAAPVGPLFDEDSLHSPTLNLDVFKVKKTSQENLGSATVNLEVFNVKNKPQKNMAKGLEIETKEEGKIITLGKCWIMLTLPVVFVAILYFIMKSSYQTSAAAASPDMVTFDLLPHLNITTTSDISAVSLLKTFSTDETANGTYQKELDSILRRVYAAINKFREDHKQPGTMPPAVKGQYLYSLKMSSKNSTENCFGDKTTIKTFDFLVFVVLFFAVVLYTKVSETKLSKNIPTQTLSKRTLAFSALWTPSILDMVISMFITNGEPNILSGLLLLVGNMERLYSTLQNIGSYKKYANGGGLVKPACK